MDTNVSSPLIPDLLANWYKEQLGEGWYNALLPFLKTPEMEAIRTYILERRKKAHVYPESTNIFKAFKLSPWEDLRVVILGQDPYHTPEYATGLAFSSGVPHPLPPSLKNILKELEDDVDDGFNLNAYEKYDLTPWAKQGVLLLNTALTVEKGTPGVHANIWRPFTEAVFKALKNKTGIIYVLWGSHAQSYAHHINKTHNFIIESAHPSPLSAYRGFFGSRPFSRINSIIEVQNGPEFKIIW